MTDIRSLIEKVAVEEEAIRQTTFLAPCVRGGRVRARVHGLIYTFSPRPRNLEGWAVFLPQNDRVAEVYEEADLPLVEKYLKLLMPMRNRLSCRLRARRGSPIR